MCVRAQKNIIIRALSNIDSLFYALFQISDIFVDFNKNLTSNSYLKLELTNFACRSRKLQQGRKLQLGH